MTNLGKRRRGIRPEFVADKVPDLGKMNEGRNARARMVQRGIQERVNKNWASLSKEERAAWVKADSEAARLAADPPAAHPLTVLLVATDLLLEDSRHRGSLTHQQVKIAMMNLIAGEQALSALEHTLSHAVDKLREVLPPKPIGGWRKCEHLRVGGQPRHDVQTAEGRRACDLADGYDGGDR